MSNEADATNSGKGGSDLAAHMRRIRGLVKPENCVRSRAKARHAARVRWDAVREKNRLESVAV
jgi:hypothetical protein